MFILSIEVSLMTTMVLAAEKYLVIASPFVANELMHRMFLPFNFYPLCGILMMILHMAVFTSDDPFCLHLMSDSMTTLSWLTILFILIVNTIIIIALSYFSVASLHAGHNTRKAASRCKSKEEHWLEVRSVVCMSFAISNWLMVFVLLTAQLVMDRFPPLAWEIFAMFLLPIPSLVHPIIYSSISDTVCRISIKFGQVS